MKRTENAIQVFHKQVVGGKERAFGKHRRQRNLDEQFRSQKIQPENRPTRPSGIRRQDENRRNQTAAKPDRWREEAHGQGKACDASLRSEVPAAFRHNRKGQISTQLRCQAENPLFPVEDGLKGGATIFELVDRKRG